MFDIAWSELLLIVVLMLVVMGPKDLPKMMNSIGRMIAKARGFAREFTGSFQELAKEAELEDIIKKANRAQSIRPNDILKSVVDPEGEMDSALNRNSKPKAKAEPKVKAEAKTAPKTKPKTKPKKSKTEAKGSKPEGKAK